MSDGDLFRVTFFVKDKDLARAKRLLVGIAIDLRDEPVINAQAKNGAVEAVTTGTVVEMLEEHLRSRKIGEFTSKDAAHFLASIGRAPGSAGYLVTEGFKAGILKATNTRGTYKVVLK